MALFRFTGCCILTSQRLRFALFLRSGRLRIGEARMAFAYFEPAPQLQGLIGSYYHFETPIAFSDKLRCMIPIPGT